MFLDVFLIVFIVAMAELPTDTEVLPKSIFEEILRQRYVVKTPIGTDRQLQR